jgi:hypothetical protein
LNGTICNDWQTTNTEQTIERSSDNLDGRVEIFESDVKDEMLLNRCDVQEHGGGECIDHKPCCWHQKLCEQINCGCEIDYIITGIQ